MTDGILDTNIVVDLLRNIPAVVNWYAGLGQQRLAITPTVWMEVVQGARNTVERAQIIRFLRGFLVEHPTPDDNNWAMLQLARFHLSHGIESPDTMIASIAVRLNVPLYTLNVKHFTPLPTVNEIRPY